MKAKFVIEKLPHIEYCGDWHDKPIKWIAKATEPYLTQKFSTKKDAEKWARCVRISNSFNEAHNLFQGI